MASRWTFSWRDLEFLLIERGGESARLRRVAFGCLEFDTRTVTSVCVGEVVGWVRYTDTGGKVVYICVELRCQTMTCDEARLSPS